MLRSLLELYLIFFRMGAVTFGGGYTMLPILRREIVQKRNWMDEEAIIDYYALSQGLPGIIAVNVSVFIGYKRRRTLGAAAAALGIVSPCVLIITLIAAWLSGFQDNATVRHALAGISVCVGALILEAVLNMWKKGVKDGFGVALCFAILSISVFTRISPVVLVAVSALLGICMGRRHKDKVTP